jgi:transcriptional regulator with XRE-family HTH domain
MAKKKVKKQPTDPSVMQIKLGKRIRQLRKEMGYTSALKFAIDKDISPVQMGRWELGKNIRFDTLCKLADAFDMSLSELLKDL